MKPEDIKLTDWSRIFIGEANGPFYLELLIRTAVFFLLLVFSMRIMGKRMAAQINRVEIVALFTLAAAIGVPLETPQMGVAPAFIIAFIVIVVGKIIASIAFSRQKAEAAIEDSLTILANDGVLDLRKMEGTVITMNRLIAQLRSYGIRHLGEVKRLYVEANGSFSLVKEKNPDYGLSIVPQHDTTFCKEQPQTDKKVCYTCGKKKADNIESDACSNCNDNHWVNAIL